MKNIYKEILRLVSYGLNCGLIESEDVDYAINTYLAMFGLDEPDCEVNFSDIKVEVSELDEILNNLCEIAYEKGIIESNSVAYTDLFDTALMGVLTARPSEIVNKFYNLYKENSKKATDYFYKLSGDSNYIRRTRVAKDLKWKTQTEYGELDVTINLSKPEKDPKAIAAAKLQKQAGYPKCMLCHENVQYKGRLNFPARQTLRIIPVTLDGEDWFMQYSPYVYYNEHCIVFNSLHTPMVINTKTFAKLLDFVEKFPHYTVGSNASIPIVGGSILTHEHFQGGSYEFAMAKAEVEKSYFIDGIDGVLVGRLKWPMSVIRIESKDKVKILSLADRILSAWQNYTDEDAFIFAKTDDTPHNDITPIARMKDGSYQLDLILRNNITTEEHPFGVFHPHAELHHIKKENIGLIEAMGLAVLPARLKNEMAILADCLVENKDYREMEETLKHADWVDGFIGKYNEINRENVLDILQAEIGQVFSKVLEDAGVFKRTLEGQKQFDKFIESI